MLTIRKEDRVAVVTLDRAEVARANHHSLRGSLREAIEALDADDSVSVVLLTGQEEGFPDGLDVAALGAEPLDAGSAASNPAIAIRKSAKPIIAAVTGAAIAGGFELVLACDLVIASTNARFADTHLHVGVEPSAEFVRRVIQLIGPQRALDLSLTGAFLEAEMAYEWGLVGRLTPPEALAATALRIAHEMAHTPLAALATRKALNTKVLG
jgi:enoyl-CoA hydratase